MKRTTLVLLVLCNFLFSYSQKDERLTSIEFVQIIDNQTAEAHYYFQNNWKVMREMALDKGYIHSYQLLKTDFTNESPFHLMLITTYNDPSQYNLREEHFKELIEVKGGLRLLNAKQPASFRKSAFSVEMANHL